GQVLSGEVSPSGRLPDTMWVDNAMNPVNVNYGCWIYENAEELGVPSALGTGQYPETTLAGYVVYQEGMYLGYRYTETRYEDLVLGTANVGDYDYESVVARPFGFGLSYAEFELSNMVVEKDGDRDYVVTVTVTNTSDTYSGKCSVPVYISKPYGDYARDNQIQVPSVELVNFGKTQTLAPGESETLTITVDEKYFASYDSYGAEGYVLMDGDYYLAVGGDAHEAVNNVLAAKQANGVTIDESKMVGDGDSTLVQKFTLSFDQDKYAYSDAVSSLDGETNVLVTNLFDFADINLYEGRGDNSVDYYSRDNWSAVSFDMENGHVTLTMTEQMAEEIYAQLPAQTGNYNNAAGVPEEYLQPIEEDDGEYPTYGVDAGLSLIDMRYDEDGNEISFNDPIWDTFMDQLTWEDTVKVVSNGFHITEAIDSVGKPQTKDENGPNGFGGWAFYYGYYTGQNGLAYRTAVAEGYVDADGNVTEDADPEGYTLMTGFPANAIMAATFNRDLAAKAGNIIGNDGIWSGASGLYGVGLNIHRSPYAGRTCEYYSECGTLTGMIAAAECSAIEEKGVHVYNKHCALNDQETNRHGVGTWVNEQTLREIYLRAFEIPIVEGGAFNTMASFSRFGVQAAAACSALGTDFLRGECGMRGIIVTDYYGDMDGNQDCDPYFEMVYGVLVGGSDLPDGNAPSTDGHFEVYETGYSEMAWAMRLAAKRICYQTAWSNAMNGISSTTQIVTVIPWWQSALYTADVVFVALFAVGLIWTGVALYQERKARLKAK
ncbi:MAG: fibronectin type III-like domain-contianing protein, partial [Clostridiales bacterium]|nr:fibronectin type III-like domain-contianing protein [Clostridiales bacterium]